MIKINTKSCESELIRDEKLYDLIHFRRALIQERYEVCSFWMDQARKSGATCTEINWNISLVLSGSERAC